MQLCTTVCPRGGLFMYKKRKECIAMLLAGGQGSRLKVLTENTAKPAVPFGGKYRIIDFPLSNCVNSDIDTVGIMTQYQPLELNDYVGNGAPWGLSRNYGGVHVLPPYAKSDNSEWYKGTANAIYQNIGFIDSYNPKFVLVLSGDHIYKADYSKMLKYHKQTQAECTIAVLDVPLSEASRFGIMNTNDDNSIYEFEEKPAQPKSTKASMGVYLFDWEVLRKYLVDDEADPQSSNDFGKNIIPKMLSDGRRMFAYQFDGYWKDVGTIYSLWEANMDLLDPNVPIDLKDPDFKIYARNYARPASFISSKSSIRNSLVAEGCNIEGNIENSIISTGCTVEEGAQITHSVIMPNAVVKKDAVVRYAIIGEDCVIGRDASIGALPEGGEQAEICVVGKGISVPDGKTIVK